MKLSRWLQKDYGKTIFFEGNSLLLEITCQILKHLLRQKECVRNAFFFGRKYDLFLEEGVLATLFALN